MNKPRNIESESVQGRVKDDYLPFMFECSLARTHLSHTLYWKKGKVVILEKNSFKKDDELIARKNEPLFKAPSDGHFFSRGWKVIFCILR